MIRAPRPPAPGSASADEPLRVLVVEDSPADAELMISELERAGFAVRADVAATRDHVATLLAAGRYDVALSDYHLPQWTGMDALALLRQGGFDTPLIIVTGTLGDEKAVDCIKEGAADYVTKDHLARIPVAVRRALGEQSLREKHRASEYQYRQLFQCTPLPIWVFDLETHRVLAVNDAAIEHYGYAREECLALRIEQLAVPATVADLEAHLARMPAGLHSGGTWRQLKKDGSEITVEVTGYAVTWGGRPAELALMVDVTERLVAEEVLKEREERFRQLVENMHEVFYILTSDFSQTLYVSPAFDEVWGWSRQRLFADPRSFMEPIPPEDRIGLMASIALIQQGQEGGEIEFRIVRPDGQVRWVLSHAVPIRNEQGDVYRIAGVALDITERKSAEQALAERTRVAELGAEIGIALSRGRHLREILQGCCEALVRNLDAAFARIWTLNEAQQVLELQASAGLYTHLDGPHSRVKVGQYKIGLIASEGLPHVTNSVIGDPRVGDQEWARREGMVAFAGHPLLVQGRLVGVMAMFARRPLSAFVQETFATVADGIAVGIARTRGEELIRELTVAVEQSPAGVMITNTEGTIEYVNERFTEITGYTSHDAVGQKPSLLKSGLTLAEQYADLWTTIKRGAVWRGEIQNRAKSGDLAWIAASISPIRDAAGRIIKFVALQDDITERKRTEAALRASEQRSRILFETVHLIVLELDAAGKVVYVNPFFLALTGYARDEVLGRGWIEHFLPTAQHEQLQAAFQDLVEQGLHPHYQNAIVTKAGKERMISWHNTQVRDAQGRATGTLSVGQDVTEHLLLEQQFRQAQKMEAVGRLAGGVAHDFNNLLTAILGSSELALEDLPPDAAAREDLEEIRKAGQRAAGLTRQLLAFSRQQVLAPQLLDLNALVANMEKLLQRLIGEDVALRTTLASPLGAVRADPGQLEQVIVNLVVNARDAMPRGGQLTIETSNVDLDEGYADAHFPAKAGAYVLLTVADTGSGMDANTKSHLFEPFFTTKEQGKGTGLGLATVYGIVKQTDGYVWVYSELGHGTAFKIYLPRIAATADRPIDQSPTAVQRGTETVLVVEDDEQVRRLTRKMLEARGFTVLVAPGGAAALELLETHAGPIDLLVTDVIMPGMSGRELAEQVAVLRPSVKVLYLSGYTDDAVVRHGVLRADIAFLQKPFAADTLARKVREVLNGR